MQKKFDLFFYRMTYVALWVLAISTFVSVSLSALHHVVIIVPGIYFLVKSIREKRVKLSSNTIFLLVMIVGIILSIVFNWSEFDRPIKQLTKVKYLLLGFLAIFAIRETYVNFLNKKNIRYLLNAFFISTTVATISGLIAFITGYNYLKMKPACAPDRACGMYGMTITYGYGIALALIAMITLIFYRKRFAGYFSEKLLWLAIIVNSLGLYFSFARGAMLGFMIGFLALIWLTARKVFIAVCIVFFAVVGVELVAQNVFQKHLLGRYLELGSSSFGMRISLWRGAVHAFKENPIFGLGYRNFENHSVDIKRKYSIGPYTDWKGHAHNNYLEMLAACGIFAFICLCLWHLQWFIKALRSKDDYHKLFLPFIVALVASGMFQNTLTDGENMFLIMLLYGLSEVPVKSS